MTDSGDTGRLRLLFGQQRIDEIVRAGNPNRRTKAQSEIVRGRIRGMLIDGASYNEIRETLHVGASTISAEKKAMMAKKQQPVRDLPAPLKTFLDWYIARSMEKIRANVFFYPTQAMENIIQKAAADVLREMADALDARAAADNTEGRDK